MFKSISLRITVASVTLAFSPMTFAAEGSLNAWGEAFVKAFEQQAQAGGSGQANASIKPSLPADSNKGMTMGKAIAERVKDQTRSWADTAKAETARTQSDVKSVMNDIKQSAGYSLNANGDVSATRNEGVSVNGSANVVANVGLNRPSVLERPITDRPIIERASSLIERPLSMIERPTTIERPAGLLDRPQRIGKL